MTAAVPLNGIGSLGVIVLSVDGNTALVRDQTGRQFPVQRDVLRAHSPLPQPGEQWIIDRALGANTWSFMAIIGGDVQTPMITVVDAAARLAIQSPYPNMAVYQLSSYSAWRWTGLAWEERISPAQTALQAQVNALPKGIIGITRRLTDVTATGTGWSLLDSVTVQVTAGRTYEIKWSCNQAGSIAAGPPNGAVAIVSGAPFVIGTSAQIRNAGIRTYNGTQEIIELMAEYDAVATETRAFGTVATPNSATATITFYGGQGRFISVEDKGLTPP